MVHDDRFEYPENDAHKSDQFPEFCERQDRFELNTATSLIGAAVDLGTRVKGCARAPDVVDNFLKKHKFPLQFEGIVRNTPNFQADSLQQIVKFSESLAEKVISSLFKSRPFVVIGGDHCCAIGTWSGAAKAIKSRGPLGLIWIDAHMDCHTPETSPSGAIHGMPLAALLGCGPPQLTEVGFSTAKLFAENICLIGVRSYEKTERKLLDQLGVRVFFMDEVRRRGMAEVFSEAMQIVTRHSAGFAISLDLDAIDPEQAPGVGIKVNHGLSREKLMECLAVASHHSDYLGVEIAEFNPRLDQNSLTLKLVFELLTSVLGESYADNIRP